MSVISPITYRSFPQSFEPYRYVRTVIALILFTSAVLKTHQLITTPVPHAFETGFFDSRWVQVLIVEVESILAFSLLLNLYRRTTWAATLILFSMFAFYSATKAFAGEACGCFGVAGISPYWSFTLDASIVVGLCVFRPPHSLERQARSGVAAYAPALAFAAVSIAGTLLATATPENNTVEDGIEIIGNRFAITHPGDWVGKRFPLFRYIDIRDRIATGNWTVVFYRSSCTHCRHIVSALENRTGDPATSVAFIEAPPHTSNAIHSPGNVHGTLSDEFEWKITLPLIVRVKDGIVTGHGTPSS